MTDYFVIGFRIALPVFATTLLLNCILAILARIAPQMNMFVVGMQLKIFVGIFVILFTIGSFQLFLISYWKKFKAYLQHW